MSDQPSPRYKGEKLVWRIEFMIQTSVAFTEVASKSTSNLSAKRIEEHYIADTFSDEPYSGLYWKRVLPHECLDYLKNDCTFHFYQKKYWCENCKKKYRG